MGPCFDEPAQASVVRTKPIIRLLIEIEDEHDSREELRTAGNSASSISRPTFISRVFSQALAETPFAVEGLWRHRGVVVAEIPCGPACPSRSLLSIVSWRACSWIRLYRIGCRGGTPWPPYFLTWGASTEGGRSAFTHCFHDSCSQRGGPPRDLTPAESRQSFHAPLSANPESSRSDSLSRCRRHRARSLPLECD